MIEKSGRQYSTVAQRPDDVAVRGGWTGQGESGSTRSAAAVHRPGVHSSRRRREATWPVGCTAPAARASRQYESTLRLVVPVPSNSVTLTGDAVAVKLDCARSAVGGNFRNSLTGTYLGWKCTEWRWEDGVVPEQKKGILHCRKKSRTDDAACTVFALLPEWNTVAALEPEPKNSSSSRCCMAPRRKMSAA
jgi:hypothetical protein